MRLSNSRCYLIVLIPVIIFCVGCRTTKPPTGISSREDFSDLGKVAGSIAGKPVSEKDLINLNKQIKEDPETRSAVETITGSLSGGQGSVKYCPIDGERYASNIVNCPVHQVELRKLNN